MRTLRVRSSWHESGTSACGLMMSISTCSLSHARVWLAPNFGKYNKVDSECSSPHSFHHVSMHQGINTIRRTSSITGRAWRANEHHPQNVVVDFLNKGGRRIKTSSSSSSLWADIGIAGLKTVVDNQAHILR